MKLALACLVLIACDDGGGGGMGTTPDAAPGTPACTGVVYDVCAADADCTSQDCHFFDQSNFTVCTQACNATTPCPADKDGTPGTCNNRGICKPAVANACAL